MAATSRPFANLPESQRLMLGRLAQTFNCRPSALLTGAPDDFQIDLAVAVTLWQAQLARAESGGEGEGNFQNVYW